MNRRNTKRWVFSSSEGSCTVLIALMCLTTAVSTPGCSGLALMAAGEDVRLGLARLTVANAGAIASRINADTTCGFASDAALESATIQGNVGEQGSITLQAECEWNWNPSFQISEPNCLGEGGQIAGGRLQVRATQTRFGLLTGDDDAPIIPAGSESVVIDVEVDYEDFYVQDDLGTAANYLFWDGIGSMSFSVQPRLAVSTDPEAPGICAAVTGNSWLKNIRFSDAQMTLVTASFPQPISVAVNELNIESAYSGEWSGGFENQIFGNITVENQLQDFSAGVPLVPEESDSDSVPVYDSQEFQDAWACEPEGFGSDPDVRAVYIDEETGRPDYDCVSEIPPARLGDGAARLTVSTFADVVRLIQADSNCGFASEAVLDAALIEENGGGRGKVTYQVSDCELAFPLDTVVSTNCDGVATKVSGRVIVSGDFTLEGRLTGDRNNPVLPLSPDAVAIDLKEINFKHFRVRSDLPEFITIKEGSFAGTLKPKLAVGESTGACSVPTTNVLMENLRFLTSAQVLISAPQGQFDAEIAEGAFRAVNGEYDDEVDAFSGSITIGGEVVTVPAEGEHPGLVPGFDLDAHRESLACIEDLKLPVTIDGCADIEAELISGAARLSVGQLGTLTRLLQDDANCGLSAPEVLAAVQTSGEVGKRGGVATWTVTDCVMTFPEPTVVSTDCLGEETIVQGAVTASGTLSVAGWLAAPDNNEQPIVPDNWQPATIDVSFNLDNFSVRSERDEYLTAQAGTLSGIVRPQTGIDTETGACSIPTNNAELSDVSWTANSELIINVGDFAVEMSVDAASMTATNGRLNGKENFLQGTLTLDGETFDVPYGPAEPAPNILVPDFSLEVHNDRTACEENFQMPESPDECSFYKVIGEGTARLIIQAMGEAASAINSDADCGFENLLGILQDSDQTPAGAEFGELGTLTFYTDRLIDDYPDGCPMVFDASAPSSTDCLGGESYVDGTMTVRSTRVVSGEFECAFNLFGCIATGIIPHDHNEVDVGLDAVTFTNFSQWSIGPNGEPPPGILTIPDGSGTGHVFPILGAQADDTERFMVATPVAYLKDINFNASEVTLEAEGRIFKFAVDGADLNAFNGSWAGDNSWNQSGATGSLWGYAAGSVFSEAGPYENYIEGSITVDGNTLNLSRQGLDPGFEKQAFEDAYNCEEATPNLLAPIPQAP